MSYWYEPKLDDIDITEDGEEMHIHITDDYNGAVYVSIKIKDVKKALKCVDKPLSD